MRQLHRASIYLPKLSILCWLIALLPLATCQAPVRDMYLRPDSLRIGEPSVSPDGKLIAFGYVDLSTEPGRQKLALYHVDTDRLEALSQPERFSWTSPHFSPDGRQLALASECTKNCEQGEKGSQIATFDLTNSTFKVITKDFAYGVWSPVFAPDGKEIWFVSAGGDDLPPELQHFSVFYGISSVSIAGGAARTRLPNPEAPFRFVALFDLSFLDQQSVVFSAIQPHTQTGRANSGINDLNGSAYLLTSNGRMQQFGNPPMTGNIDVSWKAGRIVFVDGRFDYDVFIKDTNGTRRITSLGSHIFAPAISADGQTVAFLEDHERHTNWELWVADLRTGEVRKTTVRSKLRELIAARLPGSRG